MTVAELIEKLEIYPEAMEVLIESEYVGAIEIDTVQRFMRHDLRDGEQMCLISA